MIIATKVLFTYVANFAGDLLVALLLDHVNAIGVNAERAHDCDDGDDGGAVVVVVVVRVVATSSSSGQAMLYQIRLISSDALGNDDAI